MNMEFKNLAEALEKEAGFYEELASVLDKERAILRRMDIGALEESNGIKANILTQIARLEKKRVELTSSLALAQGLPERDISLMDLLRQAPAPFAGRLLEVRTRLKLVVEDVKERNDRNQRFIDEMLLLMGGIVDKLREMFTQPALYCEKGKMGKGTLNGGELLHQSA